MATAVTCDGGLSGRAWDAFSQRQEWPVCLSDALLLPGLGLLDLGRPWLFVAVLIATVRLIRWRW